MPQSAFPSSPGTAASRALRGLHRIRGTAGLPNDVRVTVRERQFDMTEAEYRQRECEPEFERLTWRSLSAAGPLTGGVPACA